MKSYVHPDNKWETSVLSKFARVFHKLYKQRLFCVESGTLITFILSWINGKARVLLTVMRQMTGNLFSYSFESTRHVPYHPVSLYFYCSSLYYHSLLLKSYKELIFSAICPLLITTSFSYCTISIVAAHVLCNLPLDHLPTTARSMH